MTRREQLVLVFVGCSIALGAVVMLMLREAEPETSLGIENETGKQESASPVAEDEDSGHNEPEEQLNSLQLVVSVQGAVKIPGVYEFESSARVATALESAGGVQPSADTTSINLAVRLVDGTTLYIPDQRKKDTEKSLAKNHGSYILGGGKVGSVGGESFSPSAQVNINTATAAQLEQLPGIGPAYAKAIVAYRTKHRFRRIEEVTEVHGIDEKRFEALRDLITVQ